MQRPDGTLTGNAEEMDELVHAVWMPVLRMYTNKPEPSWDAFRSRFGVHFPSAHVMPKQRLTVKSLRGTLQRMKKSSACGPDGWRVGELLALPDILLERLVDILCIVEQTGIWPNDLAQGFITLTPKGEGAEPAHLRPISVMSVIYRAWAGTRLRELLEWQDTWVSVNLHGYRPRHGPEHVWWSLALRIERALIEGTDLAGISLDYAKCFDRVPSNIVFRLARESGMSEDILKPLEGMFKQLRRRFVIGGGVGKQFASTNGIMQGCPLSVILLNLLVTVWIRAIETEVPSAQPFGFADDTGATAHGDHAVDTLQKVLSITKDYERLTGQRLNAGKSKCWGTSLQAKAEAKQLHVDGEQLKCVDDMRCLGAHLSFSHSSFVNKVAQKVLEPAKQRARRIGWLPLPMQARAQLVGSMVNPYALYSFPSCAVSWSSLMSLRAACLSAVWGSTRKLKAPELVMIFYCERSSS